MAWGLGSELADATGAGVEVAAWAISDGPGVRTTRMARVVGPGAAPPEKNAPTAGATRIMTTARATRAASRPRLRLGARAAASSGRISGPAGANGGRGRTVPVIDLATQVRQLRREALQQSLQTNRRHSWQKRKLLTKDW